MMWTMVRVYSILSLNDAQAVGNEKYQAFIFSLGDSNDN